MASALDSPPAAPAPPAAELTATAWALAPHEAESAPVVAPMAPPAAALLPLGADEDLDDPCAICRDELGGSEDTSTSCGHRFHRDCLMCWLVIRPDCPICRQRFPTAARLVSSTLADEPRRAGAYGVFHVGSLDESDAEGVAPREAHAFIGPLYFRGLAGASGRPRRAGAFGVLDIGNWDDSDAEGDDLQAVSAAQHGALATSSPAPPVTTNGEGFGSEEHRLQRSPADRTSLPVARRPVEDASPRFVPLWRSPERPPPQPVPGGRLSLRPTSSRSRSDAVSWRTSAAGSSVPSSSLPLLRALPSAVGPTAVPAAPPAPSELERQRPGKRSLVTEEPIASAKRIRASQTLPTRQGGRLRAPPQPWWVTGQPDAPPVHNGPSSSSSAPPPDWPRPARQHASSPSEPDAMVSRRGGTQ
jgi:hypothetical protein